MESDNLYQKTEKKKNQQCNSQSVSRVKFVSVNFNGTNIGDLV